MLNYIWSQHGYNTNTKLVHAAATRGFVSRIDQLLGRAGQTDRRIFPSQPLDLATARSIVMTMINFYNLTKMDSKTARNGRSK